ncbi:MAG TPA: LysE family transporter [Thermoanaerobaculia bacterium]|jgi:threonine/homoserine/homoserine lactone efflux protein
MNLFVKGLIVGFALAAPVGPIAAICVQRTISKRWISGVVSGMGAAVADAVYGAIAAFGATFISEFLISERQWLQRIGGVILILLGLRLIFFTKLEERKNGASNRGLFGDFLSTFVLTLTNPMTFVAFAAIFTTMGIGAVRGEPILTAELVGGVFAGSALWWLILCGLAYLVRNHFDFRKLGTINRATGVFVIAVGVLYLFVLHPGADEATPIQRLVPHELKAKTPSPAP